MEGSPFHTIPLNVNEKTPMLKGWRETSQDSTARHLWSTERRNYGVLTGGDIIVFDYDVYKYDFPEKFNLESLKNIHGNTYIVSTPKGGFHVYHKFDDKIKHWKGITGINGFLDLRTTGNYVVGEGSKTEHGIYQKVSGDWNNILPIPDGLFENIEVYQQKEVAKKEFVDIDEMEPLLENMGFSGIRWYSDYGFSCDQKGKGTICPLCNRNHENNNFYCNKDELGIVWVKNQSQKCIRKKVFSPYLFNETEQKLLEDEKVTDEYLIKKKDFEKQVCCVLNPLSYVIEDNPIQIVNVSTLRERFLPWFIEDTNKPTKFVEHWLTDASKRTYKKIEFAPNSDDPDIYNLWKGYRVEKYQEREGNIEPFLELINDITGGESDYLLKWFALLFQKPEEKPITSPVFMSRPGCGKNSLFDFIELLMGDGLCFTTTHLEDDVIGRFSCAFQHRKFVFIDEIDSDASFRGKNKLKGIISNPTIRMEQKGMMAITIKNLAGVAFGTNNDIPVKIEDGDRRFFVFESSEKLRCNTKFWNFWLKEWSVSRANQRAVYDYLMSLDISNVDWIHDRPLTDVFYEVKRAALGWDIKFIEYLVLESNDPMGIVSCKDLLDTYNMIIPQRYDRKSIVQFGKMMRTLVDKKGLPAIQYRTYNKRGWTMDRKELFDWLVKNKYTEATELPELVPVEHRGDF